MWHLKNVSYFNIYENVVLYGTYESEERAKIT